MMMIVIAGIYNLFRVHNLMAAKQEETTLMQQELLATMVQIAEDLRMCGYSPGSGTFGFNGTGPGGSATTASEVFCTKDANGNGALDEDVNATEYAAYRHNANNTVSRLIPTNGTSWEEVATNIGDLNFTYLDSDGDEIVNPATEFGKIRTVQFTAIAIPSEERSKLGIGNRTMTTSVLCRNIGLDH